MPDTARRAALLERSKALREKATAVDECLKDQKAREFLRTMVFHRLDDVDGFLLREPESGPSLEMWDATWLGVAATMIEIAGDSFAKFERHMNRFGGSEKVALVG